MSTRPGPPPSLKHGPHVALGCRARVGAAVDLETDRRYLELVRQGKGSQLAGLTPEELQESGDHKILDWIIALGKLGDIPADIVDVRDSHTQLAFRVAALWG